MDLKSCYLGDVVFLLELQEIVLWKECLWRQKANKTWNGQTGWLHLNTGIIDRFGQKAFQTTDLNQLTIKIKFRTMLGSHVDDIWFWNQYFCNQLIYQNPGWLHAGQLHGGHRDHGEGVRGGVHAGQEHHRQVPPAALWTGSYIGLRVKDYRLEIIDKRFLKVAIVGLGGGWLRDFQEDDDSEEHWPSDGSPRTVAAKVQTLNTCPRNIP